MIIRSLARDLVEGGSGSGDLITTSWAPFIGRGVSGAWRDIAMRVPGVMVIFVSPLNFFPPGWISSLLHTSLAWWDFRFPGVLCCYDLWFDNQWHALHEMNR